MVCEGIYRINRQINKQAYGTQILMIIAYYRALIGSITTTPIGLSKRDSMTAR
jgi:hypothetical protein